MAAGDVTISSVNKALLIARCKATKISDGTFPDPIQKSTEIADVLRNFVNAITPTGS